MRLKNILKNGFIQLFILWILSCFTIMGLFIFVTNGGFNLSLFNLRIDILAVYGGFFMATMITFDGFIFQIGDSLNKLIQKRALRSYLQKMTGGE